MNEIGDLWENVERAIWRETYRHDTLLEYHEIATGAMHHKRIIAARKAVFVALSDIQPESIPREIPKEKAYCGFCGKGESEVVKLIEGPITCICDECIELSYDVCREAKKAG